MNRPGFEHRHGGGDVRFESQQGPLLERQLVGILREHLDFEAQLAAERGFVGQVDVEAHVVDTKEGRSAADEN